MSESNPSNSGDLLRESIEFANNNQSAILRHDFSLGERVQIARELTSQVPCSLLVVDTKERQSWEGYMFSGNPDSHGKRIFRRTGQRWANELENYFKVRPHSPVLVSRHSIRNMDRLLQSFEWDMLIFDDGTRLVRNALWRKALLRVKATRRYLFTPRPLMLGTRIIYQYQFLKKHVFQNPWDFKRLVPYDKESGGKLFKEETIPELIQLLNPYTFPPLSAEDVRDENRKAMEWRASNHPMLVRLRARTTKCESS